MNTRTILIENEYACLWYYPDEGIIHHKLLQPVPDDVFRTVLLSGLKMLQQPGAQKWLSDDRGNSILSAENSAWSQEFWLPQAIQAGWKHWALLPTKNPRGRINVKRLTKDVIDTYGINFESFSDSDEAWHWLARQDTAG